MVAADLLPRTGEATCIRWQESPPLVMALSSKHRRTLERIFEEPTRADVEWQDFVALVVALGGEWRRPGRTGGARRRAQLRGVKGVFHSPHPGSVMRKGSVESARVFLRNAGITPGRCFDGH